MSDLTPRREADYCYRHPGRVSYILCQRCTRTICTECQTPAPVGVQCPECIREAARRIPRPNPVAQLKSRLAVSATPVTFVLIAVIAAMFGLQLLFEPVTDLLLYAPIYTNFDLMPLYQPWRMLSSIFLHATHNLMHVGFNLLALWLLGGPIEKAVGSLRFLALFLVAGFGGSVAVQWLSEPWIGVVGASGGVLGLLGAYFVFSKEFTGKVPPSLLIVVGINLFSGFFWTGISWQAHLGGFIAGAGLAFLFLKRRERSGRPKFDSVWIIAAALAALSVLQSAL